MRARTCRMCTDVDRPGLVNVSVQPSLNANIHALLPVRFLNPNYDHHRAGSDGLGAWQSSVTECLLTQWQIVSIFISTSSNFEHHGAPDFHARPSRFRFQSTHKCPTHLLYTPSGPLLPVHIDHSRTNLSSDIHPGLVVLSGSCLQTLFP